MTAKEGNECVEISGDNFSGQYFMIRASLKYRECKR